MIRADDELASEKILTKVLGEVHDGQKLLSRDAVVQFVAIECSPSVGDDSLLSFLQLRQNTSDTVLRGIRVQDEGVHVVWKREDWR